MNPLPFEFPRRRFAYQEEALGLSIESIRFPSQIGFTRPIPPRARLAQLTAFVAVTGQRRFY